MWLFFAPSPYHDDSLLVQLLVFPGLFLCGNILVVAVVLCSAFLPSRPGTNSRRNYVVFVRLLFCMVAVAVVFGSLWLLRG